MKKIISIGMIILSTLLVGCVSSKVAGSVEEKATKYIIPIERRKSEFEMESRGDGGFIEENWGDGKLK